MLSEEDVSEKIEELVRRLETDPYDFVAYAQLIEKHRARGDLEETRAYRQKVQALYCLPEEMWLEWLHDELNLAGDDPEKSSELIALFETAFTDYHYRKVGKLYLKFLINRQVPDSSHAFERVLKVWGIDVDKGVAFWQLYLEYENENKSRQETIRRRVCALPIEGSDEVFSACCKSLVEEQDTAKLNRLKQKHCEAQDRLAVVRDF